MIYEIRSNQNINYNPENEIEDVLRNVHMILRVTKQEQALMRNFAIDSDLIDKNIDVVKNKLVGNLLEALKEYEPRALLKAIDIDNLTKDINDLNIILQIEVMI